MLRSSSIFGLSEPARAYLRHNQAQEFNCADTLTPDLGTRPYKATVALAPPVQLSPNPSLLAAQLHVMPRGISVSKTKLDSFTPDSQMQVL